MTMWIAMHPAENSDKPRTCFRADGKPKRSFATKAEAKYIRRKNTEIYQCQTCHLYHVASKTHHDGT